MATFVRRRVVGGFHTRAIVRRGARSWSRTLPSKKAARSWARAFEAELDAGRGAPMGLGHTLAAMIDRYVTTVLPAQRSGRQTEARLRRWLALLGDRPITDITARDLAEARDTLTQGLGPGTVRRYLSALSSAFNRAAKDWQWIAVNPVRTIIWPREPRGRVRYLADDELTALRAACARVSRDLADLVDLALVTGMRRGELLGLCWGAVDWTHRRLILLETKNGERRQVPLTPAGLAVLRARCPKVHAGQLKSWRVFPRRGDQLASLDMRGPWRRACEAAGLEDFRFHDLRHTAASYLAMTGATSNQIAEILGHKTLAMVKRYAHLSVDNQAEALERLSSRLLPS